MQSPKNFDTFLMLYCTELVSRYRTEKKSEIFGFAECEIIHFVNCEISPFGRCEMKFAHIRVSEYFTFAKQIFHRIAISLAQRANFVEKSTHCLGRQMCAFFWWEMVDSDHRSRKTTDLQSAPFGHSGIPPGAGDRSRTNNLLITNQLLCH